MRRFLRLGIPLAVVTAGVAVLLLTQPWGGDVAESNVRTHRFCNVSIDVPENLRLGISAVPRFYVWAMSRNVLETPGLADMVLRSDRAQAEQNAAIMKQYSPSELTDDVEDGLNTVISIHFANQRQVTLPSGEAVTMESEIYIDAETGQRLLSLSADPAEEAVLNDLFGPSKLRVAQADSTRAVWPYAGSAAGLPARRSAGDLSYQPPDPDSGIGVQEVLIDTLDGPSTSLIVQNCRSYKVISSNTGGAPGGQMATVVEPGQERIDPADAEAFARFSQEVRVADQP